MMLLLHRVHLVLAVVALLAYLLSQTAPDPFFFHVPEPQGRLYALIKYRWLLNLFCDGPQSTPSKTMQPFVWEDSPRPHGDCSPLDVTPYYPVVITYRCLDNS